MQRRIERGAPGQIDLALLPLKEVSERIAADMLASGAGKHCGACGKPFTVARKWRGVVRITLAGESGLMLNTWLLCGKCNCEAQRNGGKPPADLKREAQRSYDALRLMREPVAGTA